MSITFNRLIPKNLDMLCDWLNRSHVAEYWDGQVNGKDIAEKYKAHMSSDSVFGYIVHNDGQPIGYVQTYEATKVGEGWWADVEPGTWGIDQFMADKENLGRGIGTVMVKAFCDFVFQKHEAQRIITDPAPNNPRAIRCYEKCGFVIHREVDTPDGPALLMILEPKRKTSI